MKTKDVVMKNVLELPLITKASRVKIIAALFSIVLICSVVILPEVPEVDTEKETVTRVSDVKLQKKRKIMPTAEAIRLEPMRMNAKAQMVEFEPKSEKRIEQERITLAPTVIAPTERIGSSEVIASTDANILPEENVTDNVIEAPIVPEVGGKTEVVTTPGIMNGEQIGSVSPALAFKGTLRTDYCIGAIVDLSELTITLDGDSVPLDLCAVTGMDTQSVGAKSLTVTYEGESVEIPYGVVDYKAVLHTTGTEIITSLRDYALDAEAVGTPNRLGKEFTGWYRDAECTIPFISAKQGEVSLELYAGWKDFANYICDDSGYIQSYSGASGSVRDGLLNLPAHSSCVGVRATAFAGLNEFVTDVYVPANITNIESGAFDVLPYVFWIYVHPDNPVYTSVDGILYTKDMSSVVAYPSQRVGW